MLEFKEVKIKRILNQTYIDLGEYVINPFMGCQYSCLYCYVRSNRVVSRKQKPWGEYVDVRINAPELLQREIALRKPKVVLLGSTTECFQPIEKKYNLTRRLIEILNIYNVYYVILTRSPYILDYIPLLKEGFCKKIFFTVNKFSLEYKQGFEPKSPALIMRDDAVNILLKEGLPVVPYFSPVMPWISDIKDIFSRFKQADSVEFECLNFRLNNINQVINNIALINPALKSKYERMLNDRLFYAYTWRQIREDIERQAMDAKKRYNIYIHNYGDYFKNIYSAGKD